MNDLIRRESLLEDFGEEPMVWTDSDAETQERNDWRRYKSLVENAPAVDAVSRGIYDQVRWERDVAIGQLSSYGISLGEKADVTKVVHAYWKKCIDRGMYWYACSNCNCDIPRDRYGHYYFSRRCPSCGAYMDLDEEGTDE